MELRSLLTHELPAEPLRPEKDRVMFFQRLAVLYVRYIQIFRHLEEAYDQIVHPQKRQIIRQLLDSVMGRVLELKHEMVEKEFSEYHYMDDVIQDLKLTPVRSRKFYWPDLDESEWFKDKGHKMFAFHSRRTLKYPSRDTLSGKTELSYRREVRCYPPFSNQSVWKNNQKWVVIYTL